MEENNKFETNTEGSGSGSMLYGAESQPAAEESGHSSVYGTALQPQEPATPVMPPVQLEKPSAAELVSQEPAPVQLEKPSAAEPVSRETVPVQLEKPSGMESQSTPVQQTVPMQFGNGQPMGQPGFYGQPAFGPMQVPPQVQGAPTAKPKKAKTGLAVGILCAAAVVIFIAAGVLLAKSLFGGDPKKQLAKGYTNMLEEMAAYQSFVGEDIGLTKLNELGKTKPIRTNMDMSFTVPNASSSFNNISVGLDGVTDYKGKMAEYDVNLGTYGIDMSLGTIVAADNKMYVSVPILFQNEVYYFDLTNLGRDFNQSAWADIVGETIPEDYSMTLFDDTMVADSDAQSGNVNELLDILKRQSRINADSVEATAIKQKEEFSYGGVQVTMDKDAFNESLEAMRDDILASDYYDSFMKGYQTTYADGYDAFKENMDEAIEMFLGIRFEQDIVIDYYLDKKGRIVNISTPEDIAVSSQYSDIEFFAIDIDFSGEERTLDSIEGGVYMQSGDEILFMGISRNAHITEDYYREDFTLRLQEDSSDDDITFRYANDWGYVDHTFDMQMSLEVPDTSIEFNASGGFTDIVKGEGYTFQIDSGTIRIDDEDLLLMTGIFETGVTDNHIEVPENATNILEMSESDIMSLLYGALY